MKLTYKKLGPYIREVVKKNTNLQVEKLLGVSISKKFIPSIANIIGTDMSNYKIVQTNQFAYGPVTSRNGDKISIALLNEEDCIVSTSYTVFEIIDTNVLNPEYLMMWFGRPEFDRYARYMSHGSVREIFGWEELCNTELPIPSISKQLEIVASYNLLKNKISQKKALIDNLENLQRMIYKQWFIENNPQPLNCKISEFPEFVDLRHFVKGSLGGDWGKDEAIGNYNEKVLCIRGTDIPFAKLGMKKNIPTRFILNKNLSSRKLKQGDIVLEISGGSPVQSTGRPLLITYKLLSIFENNCICSNFCRAISLKDSQYFYYFYSHLVYLYDIGKMFSHENSTTGVKNFDLEGFLDQEKVMLPNLDVLVKYNEYYESIYQKIYHLGVFVEAMESYLDIFVSKLVLGGENEF